MLLFSGRLRRRLPVATLIVLFLAVAVSARWFIESSWNFNARSAGRPLHEGACRLVSIEPGLLLLIEQDAPKINDVAFDAAPVRRPVRLLGVEVASGASPHGKPWSDVAADYIERQAEAQTLRLKFDKRRIDRSQCWLAYVYADDVLVNEQLVEEGLARARDYPGDSTSIAKRLRGAEARARAAKRGIWAGGNL